MENPAVFKGSFLFVNKNSANLGSRSTEEAYAIGSHVSGQYARWAKVARIRPAKSPRSAQSISHSTQLSHPSLAENNTEASTSPLEKQKIVSTEPSTRRQQLLAKLDPQTLVGKGNSDPFSVAAVKVDPFTNFLIGLWQNVHMQTVMPVDVFNIGRGRSTVGMPSWHADDADMIACEARLHLLLAWALTLHISSLPVSSGRDALAVKALTHKTAGIVSLQRDLRIMPKITSIRAIWHLTGTEFYGGDVVSAMIHFAALKSIVDSLGGLKNLPWALQKLVIVADMTLCQASNRRSIFDVESWDPGPISSVLSRSEAEALALSQHSLQSLHEDIPQRLAEIFIDCRELLTIQEASEVVQGLRRRNELLCWAQMRQYALSTRTTNLRMEIMEGYDLTEESRTSVELCTCLAIDYFLQILWYKSHSTRTNHAPFHHPQGSLNIIYAGNAMSPHLTLWIHFVAATVEIILHRRRQVKSRFASQFRDVSRFLQLQGFADIKAILVQFLYQDEPFDKYLNALLQVT